MAKSSKDDSPKITRIKASDNGAKKPTVKAAKLPLVKKAAKTPKREDTAAKRSPLGRIGAYFKGAWHELKLVRWPDRKTTWKMTGALIMFTAVFAVVILLLDYGLQYLFKLLIGK